MNLLENVVVDEVSPVRRAANRRRVVLKGEESALDPEVSDIISVPWEHEGALLDSLRAAGADETVQKAAVGAIRLLKGVEDDLPDGVREVVEKLGSEMYAISNPKLNSGGNAGTPGNELDGSAGGGGSLPTWKDDAEPDDDEDDTEVAKAFAALSKRTFTAEQRRDLASSGAAMPGGRYPIANREDLQNAIHAVGRGKGSHAAIRAHIKRRAKALGATDMLPDSWGSGGQVAKAFEVLKAALHLSQDEKDVTPDEEGNPTVPDRDPANIKKEGDPVGTQVPVQKEDGTWDLDGVPEDARPVYEFFIKSQERLTKDLEDARERLAKSEETLATKEFIRKAETEFDSLAPADKLGPILKEAAEKLDAETVEQLEAVLKGANARIETGDLYAELGRAALDDGSTRTDPWSQIEKAADALVEKADTPLSKAQAIARVLDTAEGAKLYSDYQARQYHDGAANLSGGVA